MAMKTRTPEDVVRRNKIREILDDRICNENYCEFENDVCIRFRKEFDHAEDEYDSWGFDEENATIYYGERNTKSEKKYNINIIDTNGDFSYHSELEKVIKKSSNSGSIFIKFIW